MDASKAIFRDVVNGLRGMQPRGLFWSITEIAVGPGHVVWNGILKVCCAALAMRLPCILPPWIQKVRLFLPKNSGIF